MDAVLTHKQVVDDYANDTQSVLNSADSAIRSTVENKLTEGRLWPEPLLKFKPAYESTGTVDEVAAISPAARKEALNHQRAKEEEAGASLQHQSTGKGRRHGKAAMSDPSSPSLFTDP